ncbi:putative pectinesterase [Lupinus albus]|uniref:Pectinesterase n=1 Tax=Lupinus albus TaxID=3870 RepID=A0A6A4PT29_LUPAL|nr:putative pectinesterase [Lupinus albus]
MAHSFTKHQTPMSTFFYYFLLKVVFLGLCTTPFGVSGAPPSGYVGVETLMVSPSDFVDSLGTIVNVLHGITTSLLNVTHSNNHVVSDCIELLGLTRDLLDWSISATKSPKGKTNTTTGNLSSDLRTWLSAVLTNMDICMNEIGGTNDLLIGQILTNLNNVTTLVNNLLSKVNPSLGHLSDKHDQFPSWVEQGDHNLLQIGNIIVDIIVAADGSGNYTKVMDAVNVAPEYSIKRFMVLIRKGNYNENVVISKRKCNLMMIGEGMDATIISGNLFKTQNVSTYGTATFGRGFIGKDITFINTAGPENNQSVALRSDSDLSVFYRCGIFSYQDTLYAHTMRQFYRECTISGTIDFIFGNATAVFQNCQILVRKGKPNQRNTITAQGARFPNQTSCFTFQSCNISADNDLIPFLNSTETYLGRPWRPYSKTVFMQSYFSDVVNPKGWLEWNGTNNLDTLYYAEYNNTGPGAALDNRVQWPGYHVLKDPSQTSMYTVAQLIHGDLWLPLTGVNFTYGFVV